MTTHCKEIVQCSVCGAKNEYVGISSTNTMGSQDLDTRPPEMERSTISTWVQRCPNCGYCAYSVDRISPGARDVMNMTEYKQQLNDPMYSKLANSFLCLAIIYRESKNFPGATLALLRAAWTCDDSGDVDQARMCRRKAAEMLVIMEENGQRLSKQEHTTTIILVDLLRRSGQMEQAQKVIAARRGRVNEDIIARILDFHTTLINKNDMTCHTVEEAIGE